MFKKLILILALIVAAKAANIERAFAGTPQLTVLLELLAPSKMIGLNYKPYPEDKEYMPENVSKLPVFGGYMQGREPNMEKLLKAKPQIIFFSKGTSDQIMDQFKKFNITTKTYSAFSFSDLKDTIRGMSKDLGVEERGAKLIAFFEKNQAMMSKAKIAKPLKVYFAQGNDGLQSECGYKTDADRKAAKRDDLANLLHAQNVIICGPGARSRIQVNFENLLRLDPDVLFVREVALYKQLQGANKGILGKLRAVQEKRFYLAPSSPSNWLMRPPSAMRIIGLPWAFSKIYPDKISEAEIKALVQEFYKDFAKELSDEKYKNLVYGNEL